MKNGDISNEVPPRFVVTLDVVSTSETVTKKVLGVKRKSETTFTWDMRALAALWRFSENVGVTYELASFGFDQAYMDDAFDSLTNRGTNPFNYVVAYSDVQELVDELPFRRDVRGVVDVPERLARYGSWGIDMEYLNGG
jgi:hypothetical protein